MSPVLLFSLLALAPSQPPSQTGVLHLVKAGDTFIGLARRYYDNPARARLLQAKNPAGLRPGARVIIPSYYELRLGKRSLEDFAAKHLYQASRAGYLRILNNQRRARRGLSPRKRPGPKTRLPVVDSVPYRVRRGDSLAGILRRYFGPDQLKARAARVRAYNGLRTKRLRAGQRLRLPLDSPEFARAAVLARSRQAEAARKARLASADLPPPAAPSPTADRSGRSKAREPRKQTEREEAAKSARPAKQSARERAAKARAARERAAKARADRERAAKERAARRKARQEAAQAKAAQKRAAQEEAAKERAAQAKAAKERAAQAKAAKERAAQAKAAKERAARAEAAKGRAARAEAAKAKVAKERAQQAAANGRAPEPRGWANPYPEPRGWANPAPEPRTPLPAALARPAPPGRGPAGDRGPQAKPAPPGRGPTGDRAGRPRTVLPPSAGEDRLQAQAGGVDVRRSPGGAGDTDRASASPAAQARSTPTTRAGGRQPGAADAAQARSTPTTRAGSRQPGAADAAQARSTPTTRAGGRQPGAADGARQASAPLPPLPKEAANPTTAAHRLSAADAAYRKGAYLRATDHAEAGLRLDPAPATARRLHLIAAFAAVALERPAAAVGHLRRLLAQDPSFRLDPRRTSPKLLDALQQARSPADPTRGRQR